MRLHAPGRLCFLVAGGLLLTLWGCGSGLAPMTRELVNANFPFDGDSRMLEEFDAYAMSPPSKAFAVAMNPDGTVHAWAKA
jgi:hypothetical protein